MEPLGVLRIRHRVWTCLSDNPTRCASHPNPTPFPALSFTTDSLSHLDGHKKLVPVVFVSSLPWSLKFNFVPQNGVTCGGRRDDGIGKRLGRMPGSRVGWVVLSLK